MLCSKSLSSFVIFLLDVHISKLDPCPIINLAKISVPLYMNALIWFSNGLSGSSVELSYSPLDMSPSFISHENTLQNVLLSIGAFLSYRSDSSSKQNVGWATR